MNIYIYCLLLSMGFLMGALYFVKKRVLNFNYSIFWISISLILVIISLNVRFTESMARAVGISYAPAFLFLTGIVFVLVLIFYLNLTISKMQRELTLLTQEIGIIKSSSSEGETNK